MVRALTSCGARRAKWVVAAFWLAVFLGLNAVNIFDSFADAEQNRAVDYLPSKAESVKLLNQIDEFPSGERFSAVVVYRRDGGLTARDRAAIAEDRRQLVPVATAGRPPRADHLARPHDGAQRRALQDHGRGGHRHARRGRRARRRTWRSARPAGRDHRLGAASRPMRSTCSSRSTGRFWPRRRGSSSSC